jgi:pimeloyl-ACP methyl ester carboxylesterase
MRGAAFGLGLLVLAAACTISGSSKPAFRPSFVATRCPTDVEIVLSAPHSCGYLTVLEDRTLREGPTIRLFYLRVKPATGALESVPIASVGYEIAQSPSYGDITRIAESSNRELILLDQRGVGHSKPSLGCPEVKAIATDLVAEPLSSVGVQTSFREAIAACRIRLTNDGVHPAAYTLTAAAEDLEDLRRALNVPVWNLISWGSASRLLLEYVRRHPQPVRALVLSSPQFPQRDPISEADGDLNEAFRALMHTCSQSKECEREYPDLHRTLSRAVAELDRSPISASVRGETVVVDGAALVRVVRSLVSSGEAELLGQVPHIVYGALKGKVGAVASQLASDPGMCIGYLPLCDELPSLGAYLSFTCSAASPAEQSLDVYATAFGKADPYLAACRAWGIPPGGHHLAPAAIKSPALILRGEYDAFSPLDLVQQAHTTIPGARVVQIPGFGHEISGDCLRDARNSWLLHPQNVPDYSTCLRTIPTPTFAKR